jgi:hypothetical protein
MNKEINQTEEYADIIIEDISEEIKGEMTTVYEDEKIERLYSFHDGAIVKYEWRSAPSDNSAESFNHRFTLIQPPTHNSRKFQAGIIKTIKFAGGNRG